MIVIPILEYVMKSWQRVALIAVFSLLAASCGGSDDAAVTTGASQADAVTSAQSDERPVVAVTTNILGDVVEQMVGDYVDVVTIMPVGADPHDFQASAQQIAQLGDAAVLIVNGADFEEGLIDVIESVEADGTPVFEAISAVSTIEFGEGSHDDGHEGEEDHDDDGHEGEEDHDDDGHEGEEDHDDDGHEGEEDHDDDGHEGEEDHDDDGHEGEEDHDDGHDHEGADPHFFTDPARMADAAAAILGYLTANLDGVDVDAMYASANEYIAQLESLDTEVAETFANLTDDQRVLVTNHEVFGYFADRYDFEVVGAVIPSGSTADGASAQALAELAELIVAEGVPVIFADSSSSDELVQTLATEVGNIDVVELYSESLGEAGSDGATYIDMVRSNAERIATALAG
jgi:zinc/manganese transport system substrate-binding protein